MNRQRRGWVAGALLVLVGCSSDGTGLSAPVASVEVTPAIAQVQVGTSLRLTATPRDSSGAALAGRSVSWVSGAPARATVDSNGLVSGISPGAVTITATAEGVSGSASLTVISGPATRLAFTGQPVDTDAGTALAPIQVTARDAQGNTATSFTGSVSLALVSGPSGATLSGPTTVTATAGVATFSGVSIALSGTGYRLSATAGGLTPDTSTGFTIVAGPAARTAFVVQPSNVVAGAFITPAVQVGVEDAYGNLVPSFGGDVTVAIGTNPAGGTLSGTVTRVAVSGVASFADLAIDRAGTGYTLQGLSATLIVATSNPFDVAHDTISYGQSTIGASPATVTACAASCSPAGGTASIITVTARDLFGNPVAGAGVAIAVTGSNNALTPAGNQQTDASGVASWTLASTTAESKLVSATINGFAVVQTAVVTVNAEATVSGSQSTIGAAPISITACTSSCTTGGGTGSLITVTAKDQFGNPIQGASVALNATGSNNAFTPAGTTNSNGVATSTFSSSTAEGKTISATLGGVGITPTASVTVNASTTPSVTLSTAGAVPTTITACSGGCTTGAGTASLITVTAKDDGGNPIPNATVVLSSTGSNNTFTPPTTTSGSGVSTSTFTSTTAESKTITVRINGTQIGAQPTVTVSAQTTVSGSQSTIGAAPTSITACTSGCTTGGGTGSLVTVTATDQFGNPIQGASVALNATGSNNSFTAAGTTNASGVATSTFSSSTAEGKTITATLGGVLITPTASVTVIASTSASATLSTAGAAPTQIIACNAGCSTGASTASLITVTAKDAGGNPIQGATVGLSSTGSNNSFTPPTTTNSSGVSTSTFNSTTAEAKTITVTINGTQINAQPAVTVNAQTTVSGSQSTIGAAPISITACTSSCTTGGGTGSLITVTAKDQFGNPIQGASVALNATGSNNAFTPAGTTNSKGVATSTFSSSTAEAKTITATLGGVGISANASVTVNASTTPSVTLSTAGAVPTTITACSGGCTTGAGTASLITVTAKDDGGNPIPNATVVLSSTGSNNTFTPPTTTNSSGVSTSTFNSTTAEAKTITVTINGTQINAQPAVTVNAQDTVSASQSTLGAAPTTITACSSGCSTGGGTGSLITVTAKDQFGNPIQGTTVALNSSGSNNSFTTPGTTNSNGVATSTFSSSRAEGKTITATLGGVGISANASVTVNPSTTPSVTLSTAGAAPTTITACSTSCTTGTSTASLITVTAKDANGNLIPNATVVLSSTGSNNTFTPPTTTNSSGVSTSTFNSTTAEAKTITVTINGTQINAQPTVTVNAQTTVSASQSTLTLSTDTIGQCLNPCDPLKNGATIVSVMARDQFGNPVPSVSVGLSATPSSVDSNRFTNPGASGTTDAAGSFTARFASAQALLDKVIQATAGGTTITQTRTVHVMPVLVGAGDISDCTRASDDSTARLLDSIPGTVFADGDDAYPSGTAADFSLCYDPNWGRHKARTIPVLGNHEYDSSSTAADYFAYYGTAADPLANGIGYYSFDISTWHIVVLNSEPAGTASNQLTWLQGDLAATNRKCILALWHEPLFTSGPSGGATQTQRLWNALQNVGADLIINGHDHMYERFALQDSLGNADPTGIREIIVGTGGGETHANFGTIVANDQANDMNNYSRGVLRLTLYADSYRWEFIPASGFGTYTDSGTGTCH